MTDDHIGQTCPFCQQPIKLGDEVTQCPECGTPHHRECWDANGGCTTAGCGMAATGHATPATPAGGGTPPRANTPGPHGPQGESPIWGWALLGMLALLIGIGAWVQHLPAGASEAAATTMLQRFNLWNAVLGVLATLAVLTILYKENPIFRLMEHIFIGLATGFGIVLLYYQVVIPWWLNRMMPPSATPLPEGAPMPWHVGEGQWWWWFALLFGLLFFTVYIPKWSWMNRFAVSVLMGWSAGAALQLFMGFLAPQITAAFRPPVTAYAPAGATAGQAYMNPNNFAIGGVWFHPWYLVSFIVLLCVMAYFFFSMEHRYRWVRQPAAAGRTLLMITLGVIFGMTVMGRFSLIIGRFDYLISTFKEWGPMFTWWVTHGFQW